jgi:large subunit ribosomal protein L25
MHEKSPILEATTRERLGTRYTKRLRSQGLLPAIVYGHKVEPTPIALEEKSAVGYIEAGEKVFRMAIEGSKDEQVVLLKDVQFDYLGTNVIHADFARVNLDERVQTRVHINLVGEAIGLKEIGAILMHPHNEIEIECKVADIPDAIDVDISTLELNQTFIAGDVSLPVEDMKLISDASMGLAQIVLQAAAKSAESEEVEAEEGAEPGVVGEKKEEEEKSE